MNNINLITYRNKYYNDILSQEGYIIKEYNGLVDDFETEKILNNQANSIFIIEIDNYNFKSINSLINKISPNCRIIAIAKYKIAAKTKLAIGPANKITILCQGFFVLYESSPSSIKAGFLSS